MSFQLRPFLRTSVPLAMYSHYAIRNLSVSESSAAVTPLPIADITIYQYKICPYCSRPKTFLDYLDVPYRAVEVNPLTKSELSFSKDYKKVPIMTLNGDIVSDSANIIESLKTTLSSNSSKKQIINRLFTEDT